MSVPYSAHHFSYQQRPVTLPLPPGKRLKLSPVGTLYPTAGTLYSPVGTLQQQIALQQRQNILIGLQGRASPQDHITYGYNMTAIRSPEQLTFAAAPGPRHGGADLGSKVRDFNRKMKLRRKQCAVLEAALTTEIKKSAEIVLAGRLHELDAADIRAEQLAAEIRAMQADVTAVTRVTAAGSRLMQELLSLTSGGALATAPTAAGALGMLAPLVVRLEARGRGGFAGGGVSTGTCQTLDAFSAASSCPRRSSSPATPVRQSRTCRRR